ncbi:MAG: hypothetical protein FWH08_02670 [Oscillospiraceae bacterium]|nr:hypothetical protein [Oscillospiraceae bacterium]
MYQFTRVEDPARLIAEKEYITGIPAAGGINFTKFTSCLGVAVYNSETGSISGAHLVPPTESATDDEIATWTAELVANLGTHTESLIFGFYDIWKNVGNGNLYKILKNLKNNLTNYSKDKLPESAATADYKVKYIAGEWDINK